MISDEQRPEDFDWDEEYNNQRDAFYSGRHDAIEQGTCLRCGRHYTKNISQSNTSMSGYCFSCGFNP